ncbi:MAG: lipoprotein [Alphaproteobacteria bacterium]|nr:lipoprotein [Alphaproteobacteria bacterium]MDD9919994.1 lipoprotein [Alphaproteobacteria bacterium]
MKSNANQLILILLTAIVLAGCGQRVPLTPAEDKMEDSYSY